MEITGTIIEIFAEQVVGSNNFKKREFVLKTEGQYPQEIKFQAVQDKTTILNFVKKGDNVLVKFNLGGQSWTNKEGVKNWFNSLNAWRIEKVGGAENAKSVDPTDNMPF